MSFHIFLFYAFSLLCRYCSSESFARDKATFTRTFLLPIEHTGCANLHSVVWNSSSFLPTQLEMCSLRPPINGFNAWASNLTLYWNPSMFNEIKYLLNSLYSIMCYIASLRLVKLIICIVFKSSVLSNLLFKHIYIIYSI